MKNFNSLKTLSLDKIRAEECRRSYYEFFKEFWDTIEAVPFMDNWHIKYMCDQAQGVYEVWETGEHQDDLFINVPPGTSKSTIWTQLYNAWLWVRNPGIRLISSSYSSDLSISHAVKTKDCIKSDKFRRFYGHLFDIKVGEDNKSHYKTNKFGERFTTSTGGTVTGMHADFIIIDDPLNVKGAESEAERKTANEHITKTLSTRKTDKKRSVTICIMQRLHDKDPTGTAIKERQIRRICLPGELPKLDDDKNKVGQVSPPECREYYVDGMLDANRLDRVALATLKKDLGSYGYAGQILQNPSPEGGGQLKKAWFGKIGFEEFARMPATINFFLDTAYTEKQKNDPTALMACKWYQNNLYISDSEQVWKELPDLLAYIPNFSQRNGYTNASRIMIEPKASGKSVVQSFKDSRFNVIELDPPVDDKVSRVNGISAKVEAGHVFLVEGPWNENFLEECGGFPNAAHDDQVDNLVNALNRFNQKGSAPKSTAL